MDDYPNPFERLPDDHLPSAMSGPPPEPNPDDRLDRQLRDRLREEKIYRILRRILRDGDSAVFELFRALALLAQEAAERLDSDRARRISDRPKPAAPSLIAKLESQARDWRRIAELLEQASDITGEMYLDGMM